MIASQFGLARGPQVRGMSYGVAAGSGGCDTALGWAKVGAVGRAIADRFERPSLPRTAAWVRVTLLVLSRMRVVRLTHPLQNVPRVPHRGRPVQTNDDWRFVSRERIEGTMLCGSCAAWMRVALTGRRKQLTASEQQSR